MTPRRMYVGLHLLDRQLVDCKGQLAGKVDDLALEVRDDGTLHVTGILTGPGVLARRMGRATFGRWRERALALLAEGDPPTTCIPLARVAGIGNHVDLLDDREGLATFATERWVQDHVIGHIPGSGHAPE